ncbi:hypothetical protein SCLCIDRAFT_28570 [Scleroderma citrinum Foug A]|uniref:Uncharacterized protein n=1 Tax=Scleroderma citrinum Foug A TaxID=1036808 RepID=A0A0C3DNM2_9AGAM|nr:hypothetical protein SCLCIDRAFT_28570 [Scleroderma citrinum Foug A]
MPKVVGEKTTTGKPFDETARFKLDANEYYVSFDPLQAQVSAQSLKSRNLRTPTRPVRRASYSTRLLREQDVRVPLDEEVK